jgi:hypothetical protein
VTARRRAWTSAAVLLLAAAAGACRDRRPAAAHSAETTSPEGHYAAPALTPPDSACELTGLWRQCSVLDRLERAGLAPIAADSVRHAFLHVPGRRYKLGDAMLEAFVYETTTMRERDTAPLDSVRVAPPGAETEWERPPTLITSENLAAVLVGANERQAERVVLALTAGAGSTTFQPPGAGTKQ